MKGWLIYDRAQYERNEWFANRLQSACAAFCEMKTVLVEELRFGVAGNAPTFARAGTPLAPPDFAVVRTIFPLLSEMLERAGVRVFNRAAISRSCNDKRLTYALASGAGVSILPTVFFDKRFLDARSFVDITFPCVLKSDSGHGGAEVFRVESETELRACLERIPTQGFLVQRLSTAVGRDLRVYLLGERILAAVLRTSDGFYSNFTRGGRAERYPLSASERCCVEAIVRRLPAAPDLIGIDFFPEQGGLILNEIEDVVGTRMLYHTTELDAAALLAEHIRASMAAKTETGGSECPTFSR